MEAVTILHSEREYHTYECLKSQARKEIGRLEKRDRCAVVATDCDWTEESVDALLEARKAKRESNKARRAARANVEYDVAKSKWDEAYRVMEAALTANDWNAYHAAQRDAALANEAMIAAIKQGAN